MAKLIFISTLNLSHSTSPFSWTPYVIQDIWAGMLEDAAFRTGFAERNCELMAQSYALATSLLERHGIPYYRGR